MAEISRSSILLLRVIVVIQENKVREKKEELNCQNISSKILVPSVPRTAIILSENGRAFMQAVDNIFASRKINKYSLTTRTSSFQNLGLKLEKRSRQCLEISATRSVKRKHSEPNT